MSGYKDMKAWQMAHELTLQLHAITSRFPEHPQQEIGKHLRAASAAVCARLVESSGERPHRVVQCLIGAEGQVAEIESHLFLAKELNLFGGDAFETSFNRVQKLSRVLREMRSSQEMENVA